MNNEIEARQFAGYDCIQLENDALSVWITVSAGPRIIGLNLHGKDNMMAVLPNAKQITPAGWTYSLRGGHRLWHAPEDPERTYVPDDDPVPFARIDGGIQANQLMEQSTGIQKTLEVTLPDSEAFVHVNHKLANQSNHTVELAPWAITQLRPGGYAILPQSPKDTGLLPNRRLALWPYTPIRSTHIVWGDRYILVSATMTAGKLKIGWANPSGWQAYWLEGVLFVKYVSYDPQRRYYDFDSSSECYCDPRFLELESLGPVVTLEPGQSISHLERWRLFPEVIEGEDEASVDSLVRMIEEDIK